MCWFLAIHEATAKKALQIKILRIGDKLLGLWWLEKALVPKVASRHDRIRIALHSDFDTSSRHRPWQFGLFIIQLFFGLKHFQTVCLNSWIISMKKLFKTIKNKGSQAQSKFQVHDSLEPTIKFYKMGQTFPLNENLRFAGSSGPASYAQIAPPDSTTSDH